MVRQQKNGLTKKYTPGKEIIFDGYQSTTTSVEAIKDFTDNGGILYEIQTPEGVNVADVSDYKEEREVLLPRKQRYAVVEVKNDVALEHPKRNGITVVRLVAINSKGEILDGTNSDNHKNTD